MILFFCYFSKFSKKIEDNNVLKIIDGFYQNDDIFLILPYQNHKKFTDFFIDFPLKDLKHYMYSLLCSLENIHKIGIVHRDLKPDNFLYDKETRTYCLIDFGLS